MPLCHFQKARPNAWPFSTLFRLHAAMAPWSLPAWTIQASSTMCSWWASSSGSPVAWSSVTSGASCTACGSWRLLSDRLIETDIDLSLDSNHILQFYHQLTHRDKGIACEARSRFSKVWSALLTHQSVYDRFDWLYSLSLNWIETLYEIKMR